MSVRTKQLFIGGVAASQTQIYAVPTGYRTIVKEIEVTHVGNTSSSRISVRDAADVGVIAYLFWEALTSNVPVRRSTWSVLEAGQRLRVVTDAGTPSLVQWVISGTELLL